MKHFIVLLIFAKTFESANIYKGILDSKKQTVAVALSSQNNEPDLINRRFCFNCGGDWKSEHKSKCPTNDHTCQCEKKGHFRKMCRPNKNKPESYASESKANGKQREKWQCCQHILRNFAKEFNIHYLTKL
ncbi:uncharacterized protein LOC120781848 [Bactrocera tryoni]|uniref:uncharacterized protein LOC120781848 n=1 Tax=Bactrocera tryoni TaxID=59916 RepID=UPI001A9570E1|nr:uncharacterized protein LOC120781848 [Bactrocera tryoni]